MRVVKTLDLFVFGNRRHLIDRFSLYYSNEIKDIYFFRWIEVYYENTKPPEN